MITFMTTLYNEQAEIIGLINHVYDYVDKLVLVDDGSTDDTGRIIKNRIAYNSDDDKIEYVLIAHTGLCELGRIEALKHVPDGSWAIMLDADERFAEGVLQNIVDWINTNPTQTHLYFHQLEYLDGIQTRVFEKVKVFKKESAHLPEMIHGDPLFDGQPNSFGWEVIHRKSSKKQVMREQEYIQIYKKLLNEGKINQGKFEQFKSLHYFVKDDLVPHG